MAVQVATDYRMYHRWVLGRLDQRRAGSRSTARPPASSSGASRRAPRRTWTAPWPRPGRRSRTGAGPGCCCRSGSPHEPAGRPVRRATPTSWRGSRRSRPAPPTSSGASRTSPSPRTTCASSRRPDPPSRGQGRLRVQRQPHRMVRREPIGVVGQVAPWNYPFWMAIWKIGPALAAGNSVVLKPASATPITTIRLGRAGRSRPGVPAGVLNVVTGPRRRGRRGDRRAHGRRPHLAHRRLGDGQADPGAGVAATSSASTSSSAARRRSSSTRTRTSRPRRAARPRARSSTAARTARRRPGPTSIARVYDAFLRRTAELFDERPGRRPVRSVDRPRARSSARPRSSGWTGSSQRAEAAGARVVAGGEPAGRARVRGRGVLPADDHRGLRPGQRDRPEGGLRAGPGGPAVRHRGGGPREGQRHEVRPGGSVWTQRLFRAMEAARTLNFGARPGQRPPDGDLGDAPRRLQAVGLRQGHVELLVRGVHAGQARDDRADRRRPRRAGTTRSSATSRRSRTPGPGGMLSRCHRPQSG